LNRTVLSVPAAPVYVAQATGRRSRQPTSCGDCIRTLGLREGSCGRKAGLARQGRRGRCGFPKGQRRGGGARHGPLAHGGARDHLPGGTPRPGLMRCPAPGSGECPAQSECRSIRGSRRLLWLKAESATLVSIRCAALRPMARPQCGPVTQVELVKDVPHPSHGGSAPLPLKIMCFRTYGSPIPSNSLNTSPQM